MYIANLETKITLNRQLAQDPDICDRFSEQDLTRIGTAVWDGYSEDLSSRADWERRMNAAMDLAMQVQEAKTFPWPNAANVVFPLVTIAALQFSAKAYPALIQGNNVFRYRVIGPEDKAVRERALRVGKHMSWQVLEQDQAWESEHDRLLINLSIVGLNYVKTYFSSRLGYNVGELVTARDLIVNYWTKSMDTCQRATHVLSKTRNEVYENMAREIYRDCRDEPWFRKPNNPDPTPQQDKRQGVQPPAQDHSTPFRMLEQICFLDLDDDGYEEPYTVTIDSKSHKVVRINARWNSETDVETTGVFRKRVVKIKAEQPYTKYSFIPSPDGSFYDLGFGTFLGPINEAVNSAINQLLDSGTFQNSIGGFLGRGAKIRGGTYTMAPWQWVRVDSTGDDLRKNLVPFPDREPSAVTFQLIGLLIEYANRVAGTTDAQVGENPGQNTPAQTFQGMVEQGSLLTTMVFLRIWRCLKDEAKHRYALNAVHTKQVERFGEKQEMIRKEDYLGNPDQIAPVANKKMTSTVLQLQKVLAIKQDSLTTPGYNIEEVTKEFLEALEVDGIDRLYPGPGKVPPLPNPKAAVEQMKQGGKDKDRQAKLQEALAKIQVDMKELPARVRLLEAQAIKALKEAGNVDAEARLKHFEAFMNAVNQHHETMNQRIEALQGFMGGGDDNAEGQNPDGGGVRLPDDTSSVGSTPPDAGPQQGNNP